MRTVHKFAINPPRTVVSLAPGYRTLTVAYQNGVVCVWVELDDDVPMTDRVFVPVPTGGEVPDGATYVGTAHGVDGWMVFHIYELLHV